MPPDIANGPLQELMTPIFTGSDDVGVGVVVGVGVAVAMGVGVAVGVAVGVGFSSSSSPPQAGSSRTNKLSSAKNNQYFFNVYPPKSLYWLGFYVARLVQS